LRFSAKLRGGIIPAFAAIIFLNSLLTARAGFRFGFTEDDLMNAHWALTRGWWPLLSDILKFWTVSPVFRPVGTAFVKAIYATGGMNLIVWRCFYGALLCFAVSLSFLAAERITNRLPVAFLTGLLLSFYPAFRWLYFGMDFIYDVIALLFVCLFLLVWFRARETSSKYWALVAVALFILAIQSKEIAVDAIVFATVYELIFSPPDSLRSIPKWIARRPVLLVFMSVGAVFAISRLTGPNSLTQMAGYRPSLSAGTYFSHMSAWLRQLYGQPITTRSTWLVLPCLVMAFWSSWRLALWAFLSFLLGVLPVAFILQRSVAVLLVPALPLAILTALAFDAICEAIAAILLRPGQPRVILRSALAGIVCVVIVLRQGSVRDRQSDFTLTRMDSIVNRVLQATQQFTPRPNPDGKIIVESDPFGDKQWQDLFAFRLAFDAPQLQVKRPSQLNDDDRRGEARGEWRHIEWNGRFWTDSQRCANAAR
jgi:hypothetical protein